MFFDVLCNLVKPVVNSQLGWSFGHSLRFTAYKEYELTIKLSYLRMGRWKVILQVTVVLNKTTVDSD